jgi:hypothetical protein
MRIFMYHSVRKPSSLTGYDPNSIDNSPVARDFRAPAESASYLLRVDASLATEDLILNWDSTLLPDGGLFLREILLDDVRAAEPGISLNIATTSQLVIGAGQNRLFEIVYGTVEFTLRLRKGWNLISVPIQPVDATPDIVFPGLLGIAGFEGFEFAAADSIIPGKGYMVIVSDTHSVDITIRGVLVPDQQLQLNPGSNVVGPIADPSVDTVNPDSVIDVPFGRIWRRINNRWRTTSVLHLGFAHFIYSPPAFHFRGEDGNGD